MQVGAGDSEARRAESAEEKAKRLRRQADALDQMAARHRQGVAGERRLRALLQPLVRRGYRLLGDRSVPDSVANIDMIAVGPAGVFVVDAKNWTGQVQVRDGHLRQNGYSRADEVDGVLGQAGTLWQVLASAGGPTVPVWPVLCLVGEGTVDQLILLRGVYVCSKHNVCDLPTQAPVALDAAWVNWASEAIEAALVPRTAEIAGPISAPIEPVVFLTYWSKRPRYYLHDEDGTQGGFLDLVKGEAVGESPIGTQVCRQLLPHYVDSDATGLSESDRSGIRRILAGLKGRKAAASIPLVVGFLWQRHGRRRLYVHRLGADGSRADLGWYDFDDGRVYEAGPSEAVVRYCGKRYEVMDSRRRA
ncbi:MAG: nuclease-related domain-containing protein [Microthrixaceae bacterium]